MSFDISHPDVKRAVAEALAEDVRTGDITTEATIAADLQAEGHFVARQDMTLAGVELQRRLTPSHERLCGKLTHDETITCFVRCECLKEPAPG